MSLANSQQTLKNSIRASGVALHTGSKVNMTLHPAGLTQALFSNELICHKASPSKPVRVA